MSKEWYDKNEYENYPSYLMGIKKENKTDMGYGAPSPMNTPGNVQKYGVDAWKNTIPSPISTTDNRNNHDIDSMQGNPIVDDLSNKERDRLYEFYGYGGSIAPLADFGVRTSFVVEGNAKKIGDNELMISASAKGDPSNVLSGYVTVTQDGKEYSKQKLTKNPNGYIYRTGGPLPLGEAYVNLPDSGYYDVDLDIVGDIYETGSHFPTSYNKKIPAYRGF